MTDGDGNIFCPVTCSTVSDEDFIVLGRGKSGGEDSFFFSFAGVLVMKIAFSDPRLCVGG